MRSKQGLGFDHVSKKCFAQAEGVNAIQQRIKALLTCVDFSAETQNGLPYACPHNGTVLRLIVDNLLFAALDILSRGLAPWRWKCSEGLKFVSWEKRLSIRRALSTVFIKFPVRNERTERTPK